MSEEVVPPASKSTMSPGSDHHVLRGLSDRHPFAGCHLSLARYAAGHDQSSGRPIFQTTISATTSEQPLWQPKSASRLMTHTGAEAADQLANDSGAQVQYIVTMTSPPPSELRTVEHLVLEVRPGSVETLLFKRDLSPMLFDVDGG